jgi:hypothetical protein
MYSKQETQQLKKEFWINFSEKYPRKWVLYDTKIKDFSFKFYVDNKKAQAKERRRHTLPHNCSTICAGGLNFSVRDGKR